MAIRIPKSPFVNKTILVTIGSGLVTADGARDICDRLVNGCRAAP